MITTASSDVRASFRTDRLQRVLFAAYVAVWIWAAVDPVYRFDWFLENILVFLAFPGLVATRARFPLSGASYVLIFLFGCLHAVGSHYTYSEVPVGFWLQDELGLARNHYDRLVHFCFGLLLFYPLREAGRRYGGGESAFASLAALGFVFMGSASFEVLEMLVAMIVDPKAGQAYLGTQGDEWDAQKDMALAALGALLALALTVGVERRRDTVATGAIGLIGLALIAATPVRATATPPALAADPLPGHSSGLARAVVGGIHTVSAVPGDSLTAISARFGVGVVALARANGLPTDARLAIGQRLRVANVHVVPASLDAVEHDVILVNVPQKMLFELLDRALPGDPVRIIYEPVLLAALADDRICLEVHLDAYALVPSALAVIEAIARSADLTDRIDWTRVTTLVAEKEGIARDVRRGHEGAVCAGAASAFRPGRPAGLSDAKPIATSSS